MKRALVLGSVLLAASIGVCAENFEPTFESLSAYRCPDWYKDAKFGIWSHWGPQSVPMAGDWYARNMYIQGHDQYKHHLEHYGHPSTNGWKDIVGLWKAEKWDPERLMGLYKAAGAKYFVSMGVHHDAFFLWDTAFSEWNAVKKGPKRDVLGEWQKAAQKNGLKFGVSEHLAASWHFYAPSHGSDKDGPLAGIPYDGADPKWASLYHAPVPDTGWYVNDPSVPPQWFAFINELIDKYHPDLLYSDGPLPFGETGFKMLAHFYDDSIGRNGKNEAVYTCKDRKPYAVEDVERGGLNAIKPQPWQTDTSVGDWYYNMGWRGYRNAAWVLCTLADTVSKNGNMLVNMVQRPDGILDPDVETVLKELAEWMPINGEAIFATRPWLVFGESPRESKGGAFHEESNFSAEDIRYTKSKDGKSVYALVLGIPGKDVVLKSFVKMPDRTVQSVSLLGSTEAIRWAQDQAGLAITKPAAFPCRHVIVFKLTMAPESIQPAKD